MSWKGWHRSGYLVGIVVTILICLLSIPIGETAWTESLRARVEIQTGSDLITPPSSRPTSEATDWSIPAQATSNLTPTQPATVTPRPSVQPTRQETARPGTPTRTAVATETPTLEIGPTQTATDPPTPTPSPTASAGDEGSPPETITPEATDSSTAPPTLVILGETPTPTADPLDGAFQETPEG